jgi:hypothetical protein
VSDDVNRLGGIEIPAGHGILNALSKHVGTLVRAGRGVERSGMHLCSGSLPQVIRNPVKVIDWTDAVEAEDPVN